MEGIGVVDRWEVCLTLSSLTHSFVIRAVTCLSFLLLTDTVDDVSVSFRVVCLMISQLNREWMDVINLPPAPDCSHLYSSSEVKAEERTKTVVTDSMAGSMDPEVKI